LIKYLAGGVFVALSLTACGAGSDTVNDKTLHDQIMTEGPGWAAADAARGNTDTVTITDAQCVGTGSAGNYTCNTWYTNTGGISPGNWYITIPGACDSTGVCTTFTSSTPSRVADSTPTP
jgi:hypothetical protein